MKNLTTPDGTVHVWIEYGSDEHGRSCWERSKLHYENRAMGVRWSAPLNLACFGVREMFLTDDGRFVTVSVGYKDGGDAEHSLDAYNQVGACVYTIVPPVGVPLVRGAAEIIARLLASGDPENKLMHSVSGSARAWGEKYRSLTPAERIAVWGAEEIPLLGLSGYNPYDGYESEVVLYHTDDDQWMLYTTRGYGEKQCHYWEHIAAAEAQRLLCVDNLYPKPYWNLENIGISSVEEVEKIYSAKRYSSYKAKPSGFGGINETLHHTNDGRWFLLTVVDNDTDSSMTLYFWYKLTEEDAQRWFEAKKKSSAEEK